MGSVRPSGERVGTTKVSRPLAISQGLGWAALGVCVAVFLAAALAPPPAQWRVSSDSGLSGCRPAGLGGRAMPAQKGKCQDFKMKGYRLLSHKK